MGKLKLVKLQLSASALSWSECCVRNRQDHFHGFEEHIKELFSGSPTFLEKQQYHLKSYRIVCFLHIWDL